ncbi:MAG: WecB/TagA/CpsF family glycosyltransferase [Burkholderiaceae bacterium]|nr:WecB/TagA/CpsF family glycosyltransferase [Burkholderiaceae bacterium]
MASAVQLIGDRGASRQGGLVCVANVDMLTRAKRTPRLAGLMREAVAVVTDGMPLVWALKRLHRQDRARRVYGPGLVWAVCEAAAGRGQPVFLYGGTPDELRLMQARLLEKIPGLRIAGAVSPPMLPAEPPFDAAIVDTINRSGAEIVFVGLGCPKQEFWMEAHQRHLNAVSIGVGLAFALIAGTKSQAPRWMRDHGLEWLYRLCQEPGRLWRRYLVGNTLFIGYVLRELLGPRQH